MGAKNLKAIAVRAAHEGRHRAPGRGAGGRPGPAGAVVRPGHREVPRARHAGQPARVQRDQHAADSQLPGGDVRGAAASAQAPAGAHGAGDAEADPPPRSAACAASRGPAARPARSAASTSTGSAGARRPGWSTRTCSRSARCAGSATRRRCSRRAPAATTSGIDTISAGGTIAWAMECAQRGLIDAPWLRFGDSAALLRVLGEIGQRSTPLGSLLSEGSRSASRTVGAGSASFAPHVRAWRCQATSRARCTPWRWAWR